MSTYLVGGILVGLIVLAIRSLLRSKAKGGSAFCDGSCGSCAGCPHASQKK